MIHIKQTRKRILVLQFRVWWEMVRGLCKMYWKLLCWYEWFMGSIWRVIASKFNKFCRFKKKSKYLKVFNMLKIEVITLEVKVDSLAVALCSKGNHNVSHLERSLVKRIHHQFNLEWKLVMKHSYHQWVDVLANIDNFLICYFSSSNLNATIFFSSWCIRQGNLGWI
jgi:hypothetical protein